ncbi:ligand-binding domain of nuclear hormone receptor domain-containing protein [Ditylenchus destructor]|uniref:Ligand-binding domain of nuclear hormone receptor domain-containing protein n=1 Tax=Ditylenchus destructor TaxID=166010 RepID=A0AAD4MQP9_9BILA|nr:ligand-binding domain of nuclear hormone receptor domain-containing protein [Ditylenchus destructor]
MSSQVVRCIRCGFILRKRPDQVSSSSGTAGGAVDNERCLKCAVEVMNAPLAIDDSPISPDVQDASYLMRQMENDSIFQGLRNLFMAQPNYHDKNLEQVLSSGSCLAPYLLHPYIQCPSRPIILNSDQLINSANYMAFDIFLMIEFAKTVDAFRNLDLNEQVLQSKRVILPLTLFTEAYLSRASGFAQLTLPNKLVPLEIQHPKYPSRPISLYQSLQRAHKKVFSKFMLALAEIDLTPEEYLLLKLLFVSCTYNVYNAPSLGNQAKAILNANFDRYRFMMTRYLAKNYSPIEASRRQDLMSKIASHYFIVATQMKELHQLVKQYHEKEKLPAEFMDEMM